MIVFPPARRLIGHCRKGRLSALYPNTQFQLYTGSGSSYFGTVSPGSSIDLVALTASGGEGGITHYDVAGCGMIYANKPVVCIQGTSDDIGQSVGWQDVAHLGQQGALAYDILENPHEKEASSLAFYSPYAGGNVRLWSQGDSIPLWSGRLSRPNNLGGDIQRYPAGVRYYVDNANGMPILSAGVRWQSDVPVYAIARYYDGGVRANGQGVVLQSTTPENIRSEIVRGEDDMLYRRAVLSGGQSEYIMV